MCAYPYPYGMAKHPHSAGYFATTYGKQPGGISHTLAFVDHEFARIDGLGSWT